MKQITPKEYAQIERLLAKILTGASDQEELGILQIHSKLHSVYTDQTTLQVTRDRLKALSAPQ